MTPWPDGPPTNCAAPTPRSSSCCDGRLPAQDGCPATPDGCAPADGRPRAARPKPAGQPPINNPADPPRHGAPGKIRAKPAPEPLGTGRSLASRYARTLARRADAARAEWLRDGPPGDDPSRRLPDDLRSACLVWLGGPVPRAWSA